VLATPVPVARLVLAKFAALMVHATALVTFLAVVGALLKAVWFGDTSLTLYSGAETAAELLAVGQRPVATLTGAPALLRLALSYAYLASFLYGLAALGLAVSALVRQTMSAISAATAVVVLTWVVSTVPSLAPVHPYLLVAHARGWLYVASAIVPLDRVLLGLGCAAAHVVIGLTAAWALVRWRDVHA
jgi:ABC-2 type transport system permease protein